MHSYLRTAWRENNGWLLVASASAVGAILCLLWFLEWLPDLSISRRSGQPILTQTIPSQDSILVAQINTSQNAIGKRGLILLYRSDDFSNEYPAYQQSFQLDDSGMVTLLMVLPPGTYKTVAFLDLNDNGQLDFDGDVPLEPMRLPTSRSPAGQEESDRPAEITLAPREPVFCLFDFEDF